MSDDSSVERRQEEAHMRDLLQVAMAADDIVNDEEHARMGISSIPLGVGPKTNQPEQPKSKRRDLHNELTESISSSRDSRLTEEEANMLFGSKRISHAGTLTDLSLSSERSSSLRQGEIHEFTKTSRRRVARYDLTMAVFVIFSIAGALALVFSLVSASQPQLGLQLPGKATPVSIGSASSTECDHVIKVLDESIFVNSTALHDEDSPQHRAMHWICKHDPADLDVNDSAFLTRYALAVFFYSTSGRSPKETTPDKTDWTEHTNWLTGAGYCSWFGITCVDEEDNLEVDGNGEILQIDLSQNFLSGRLPGELSAITDAFGFHLDSNFLYGPIPTQFGRLNKLQDLWLSDNKLEGRIPVELGNMLELRELTVAANELTGEIPETLSQATHMHYFAVEDNHLKGTIPAIMFRSLTALETFHVSNNELTGSIPEEVYDMTSLATLRLSENNLSGTISDKLGNLINLEHLHLTDNGFNGELPDVFSELELLTECKLGENKFTGSVPASLGESKALVQLAIEGNPLTGEVPEGICALTANGFLESFTADCYTEIEGNKGTLDMLNIEGAKIIDSGSLGGMTDEEDEVLELDGVICECCTECY